MVFAAASLKDALDAVNTDWQKESGKQAVISYAASSALAKQIEQGAPADMFISADEDWMDYLATRKLIKPDTRFDLHRQSARAHRAEGLKSHGQDRSRASRLFLSSATGVSPWPTPDGARRQIRQGGAREPRRVGRR